MLKMASSYGMIIIMSIYIICPLPDLYEQHLELHLSNSEDSFPLDPMPKPQAWTDLSIFVRNIS